MAEVVLLVHGSFLGGWEWDAVALAAAGKRVLAPTLSGDGDLRRHVEEILETARPFDRPYGGCRCSVAHVP
jgi:hypothetical protein